jgi:hypothetical protein
MLEEDASREMGSQQKGQAPTSVWDAARRPPIRIYYRVGGREGGREE